MNVQLKEILRDSEIRDVRKQLAKRASQARRRGKPLTEQQKADLFQELVTEKVNDYRLQVDSFEHRLKAD